MRRVARWCVNHRLAVIAAWIAVLVGTFYISSSAGSNYSHGQTLSGTQSATAQNLLRQASPAAAGDTEQIVFATHGGSVTSAATRARIQPMLVKTSRLPNVAGVGSPYTPAGARQVSSNGTVAFATVQFTKDSNSISASEATTFVNTARAANGQNLQVEVLGDVAASTNPASQSSTLIGIVAALVILLVVFGSVLAALLPLLTTGISLLAATSVVGVLSNSISMASFTQQLCILIGLGVGIDYSLFILTRTRSGLRRGLSVQDAVVNASATAGRAVLFAGITVCIALCGMFIVGVSMLSGAAIAASISVLFPMLAAQTLPAGAQRAARPADPHPASAQGAQVGRDQPRRGLGRVGWLGATRAGSPARLWRRGARGDGRAGDPGELTADGHGRLRHRSHDHDHHDAPGLRATRPRFRARVQRTA